MKRGTKKILINIKMKHIKNNYNYYYNTLYYIIYYILYIIYRKKEK